MDHISCFEAVIARYVDSADTHVNPVHMPKMTLTLFWKTPFFFPQGLYLFLNFQELAQSPWQPLRRSCRLLSDEAFVSS